MPPNRPRDEIGPTPPSDPPENFEGLSAGARYRRHLDQFPERPADNALARAARALIRAAQIRPRAPRRAN